MGKVIHALKQTCICLAHLVYGYAKCEIGCVFAITKPQSIITTALKEVKK